MPCSAHQGKWQKRWPTWTTRMLCNLYLSMCNVRHSKPCGIWLHNNLPIVYCKIQHTHTLSHTQTQRWTIFLLVIARLAQILKLLGRKESVHKDIHERLQALRGFESSILCRSGQRLPNTTSCKAETRFLAWQQGWGSYKCSAEDLTLYLQPDVINEEYPAFPHMQTDCGLVLTCGLCTWQDAGVELWTWTTFPDSKQGNLNVKSESRGLQPLRKETLPGCALKKVGYKRILSERPTHLCARGQIRI